MKTIIKITLVSAILLLSSCNAIRVSSDFNDKINFNDYKTYAFSKKGVDEVEINDEGLEELLSISKQLNEGMYLKRESYKPNPTAVPHFLSNNFKETDNLVVIEDIYDTGKTIGLIQQMMKDEYSNHSVRYYSLFGNKNDVGVVYLREKNKKWISFPWER